MAGKILIFGATGHKVHCKIFVMVNQCHLVAKMKKMAKLSEKQVTLLVYYVLR